MNKGDLISAMATDAMISKAEASAALESITSNITRALAENKKVALVRWGTFTVRPRTARVWKNPRTGEVVTIEGKNIVKFKAGKELDRAINS